MALIATSWKWKQTYLINEIRDTPVSSMGIFLTTHTHTYTPLPLSTSLAVDRRGDLTGVNLQCVPQVLGPIHFSTLPKSQPNPVALLISDRHLSSCIWLYFDFTSAAITSLCTTALVL